MRREAHPQKIQQNIIIQQVGDELLLYDEVRHQAFCLNPVCASVWTLCDGENSISAIAQAATSQLNVTVDEQIAMLALQELRRDGLVKPLHEAIAIPTISRRDLVQRLGASAAILIPVVVAIAAPTAAQAYSGCVDCDARPAHPRSPTSN
jgi:Coenzyme PQQ synthesis protein D (PqqD)